MDPLPSGVSGGPSPLAGDDRSLCDGPESQASSLLLADVDPQSAGTDAMIQSWDDLQAYAFPPFELLHLVLAKVSQSRGLELTLMAPFWTQHLWFPDLLKLLVEVPVFLPQRKGLLKQPHFHRFHQNLPVLCLTALHLLSDLQDISASLQRWLINLPTADVLPPV